MQGVNLEVQCLTSNSDRAVWGLLPLSQQPVALSCGLEGSLFETEHEGAKGLLPLSQQPMPRTCGLVPQSMFENR